MNKFTLLIVLTGIGSLFYFGSLSKRIAPSSEVKRQCIYQASTLPFALALLILNRVVSKDYVSTLNMGDSQIPTQNMKILGIKNGTSWSEVGPTFILIPLIVTTVVVYIQILKDRKIQWRYLPYAFLLSLPFSVLNSLTEEIIFRVIPIEGFFNYFSIPVIALFCGLVFGIPHYFGNPGRIPGLLMAGFLGWIAALSILETGGIAWAWGIHFAQDIPIITFMILATKSQKKSI